MKPFGNERGIAMITVLFVGAVLTVVATTASFMTVQEFRAGSEDMKAGTALAYAEAGIDRLVFELRRGLLSWNDIAKAGCAGVEGHPNGRPPIELAGDMGPQGRRFEAVLRVYDREATGAARFAPAACASASTDIRESDHFFEITSTGWAPQAKRIIRQVIDVKPLGLPVGIYADARADAGGGGQMTSISLVSRGPITGRDKTSFTGADPYYTVDQFYGNGDKRNIPAAAHAVGQITLTKGGGQDEHGTSPLNCDANGNQGTNGQSLWDGSSGGATITQAMFNAHPKCVAWPGNPAGPGIDPVPSGTYPPTSLFTAEDLRRVKPADLSEQDYAMMKDAARSSGLYCKPSGNGLSCTKNGGAAYSTSTTITGSDTSNLNNRFMAFFDFPGDGTDPFSSARTIVWKTEVAPCHSDPALNRSVIVVVRHGSLRMEGAQGVGSATTTGAILLPEGRFDSLGSITMHGTIIAKEFRVGGNATFLLSECWLQNMPGPFISASPVHWSEIDR